LPLPYSPITVPADASFQAMTALKGKPDIGDQINKRIFGGLTEANQQLSRSDFPNFNDPVKLGDGKEMVDRLTNLIAIFENPALDFSRNRAGGDDLLGDAYEYLMRHFATESGKSMGQFYTPAEVSRIMAQLIAELSEGLLAHYASRPLIDPYDIYQHLMDYWTETLQDDAYLIAADGWTAETSRIVEKDKRGKERDKGWTCDLVPKPLVVARFFAREQAAIDTLTTELEQVTARLAELEEEHGGDEGAFAELDKVNRAEVARALRENGADDHAAVWRQWLELSREEGELKRRIRDAEADLDALVYARYARLTEVEIQALVVDDKWLATLGAAVRGEVDRVSQRLAQRVRELAERYATPLPRLSARVAELEARVNSHLAKMGFEA
jgi:type I restriction enzyme M protein